MLRESIFFPCVQHFFCHAVFSAHSSPQKIVVEASVLQISQPHIAKELSCVRKFTDLTSHAIHHKYLTRDLVKM